MLINRKTTMVVNHYGKRIKTTIKSADVVVVLLVIIVITGVVVVDWRKTIVGSQRARKGERDREPSASTPQSREVWKRKRGMPME